MNSYNRTLLAQGKKRRARLLKLRDGGMTVNELSALEGVSGARMRWMLQKARDEAGLPKKRVSTRKIRNPVA